MSTETVPVPASGLLQARRVLREKQAKAAAAALPPGTRFPTKGVTEESLGHLRHFLAFTPTDDPRTVRRGVFRFDREKERERLRRAEEVIRRVDPGPLEDANYLALLAKEVAAIEMAFPIDAFKKALTTNLLGTIALPDVNAFALSLPSTGYSIVLLHRSIIDFVYGAAKVVVEAAHPYRRHDGKAAVSANLDPARIENNLKQDPEPIDRLYRIIESYFFLGRARAFGPEEVKEEHGPLLSQLVSMAERWIVAHEYGHGLAVGREFFRAPYNARWAEEFFADTQATTLTVLSAASLDGISPEVALSGPTFTLAAFDLLRRSLAILRTGHVPKDEGDPTHPPFQERAQNIITTFRHFFDVKYLPKGHFELDFRLRKEPPAAHNFGDEQVEGVYAWSNVLFAIWPQVKERLVRNFQDGRQLHRLWNLPDSSQG